MLRLTRIFPPRCDADSSRSQGWAGETVSLHRQTAACGRKAYRPLRGRAPLLAEDAVVGRYEIAHLFSDRANRENFGPRAAAVNLIRYQGVLAANDRGEGSKTDVPMTVPIFPTFPYWAMQLSCMICQIAAAITSEPALVGSTVSSLVYSGCPSNRGWRSRK